MKLATSGNADSSFGSVSLGTQYNLAQLTITPANAPEIGATTLYDNTANAEMFSTSTYAVDATTYALATGGEYSFDFGVGAAYGYGDSDTFKISITDMAPTLTADGSEYKFGGTVTISVGSSDYYFKVADLTGGNVANYGLNGITGVQVNASGAVMTDPTATLNDGVFYNYAAYNINKNTGVPVSMASAAPTDGSADENVTYVGVPSYTDTSLALTFKDSTIKVFKATTDGSTYSAPNTTTGTPNYTFGLAAAGIPLLSAATRSAMNTALAASNEYNLGTAGSALYSTISPAGSLGQNVSDLQTAVAAVNNTDLTTAFDTLVTALSTYKTALTSYNAGDANLDFDINDITTSTGGLSSLITAQAALGTALANWDSVATSATLAWSASDTWKSSANNWSDVNAVTAAIGTASAAGGGLLGAMYALGTAASATEVQTALSMNSNAYTAATSDYDENKQASLGDLKAAADALDSAMTAAGLTDSTQSVATDTTKDKVAAYNVALNNYDSILKALGGTSIVDTNSMTYISSSTTPAATADYSAALLTTTDGYSAEGTLGGSSAVKVLGDSGSTTSKAQITAAAALTDQSGLGKALKALASAFSSGYNATSATTQLNAIVDVFSGDTIINAATTVGLTLASIIDTINGDNETHTKAAVATLFDTGTGTINSTNGVLNPLVTATAADNVLATVSGDLTTAGGATGDTQTALTELYNQITNLMQTSETTEHNAEVLVKALDNTFAKTVTGGTTTYESILRGYVATGQAGDGTALDTLIEYRDKYKQYNPKTQTTGAAFANTEYYNALANTSTGLVAKLTADAGYASDVSVGKSAVASTSFTISGSNGGALAATDVTEISSSIETTSALYTALTDDFNAALAKIELGGETYYATINTSTSKIYTLYDSKGAAVTSTAAIAKYLTTSSTATIDGEDTALTVAVKPTYVLYATGDNGAVYSDGDLVGVSNVYSAPYTTTTVASVLAGGAQAATLFSLYKAGALDVSGVTYESNGATTSYSGSFNITLGSDTATFNFTSDAGVFALTLDSASSDVGVTNVSSDSFTYDGITYTVEAASYSEISVSATAVAVDVETTNGASATTSTTTYYLDGTTTSVSI